MAEPPSGRGSAIIDVKSIFEALSSNDLKLVIGTPVLAG